MVKHEMGTFWGGGSKSPPLESVDAANIVETGETAEKVEPPGP